MWESIKILLKSWKARIGILLVSAPYWKHAYNLLDAWGNFKDMKDLLPGIWQFLNSALGTLLFTLMGFGLIAWQIRRQHKSKELESGQDRPPKP